MHHVGLGEAAFQYTVYCVYGYIGNKAYWIDLDTAIED